MLNQDSCIWLAILSNRGPDFMNKSAAQLSTHVADSPVASPLTTSDAILIDEGSSRHSPLAKQT
jgi:hypothetical protein